MGATPTAAETATGLRELADLCEERPELGRRIGRAMSYNSLSIFPDTVADLAHLAELLGPDITTQTTAKWCYVKRNWGPVLVQITYDPAEMTERKIVSTETVSGDNGETITRQTVEWQAVPEFGGGGI